MKKYHIFCKMPKCMLPGVQTCEECRFSGCESYEACDRCGIMLTDGKMHYCKACERKIAEERETMNNIPEVSGMDSKILWILFMAREIEIHAYYNYSTHAHAEYHPITRKLTCVLSKQSTEHSWMAAKIAEWSIDDAPDKPEKIDEIYRELYRIYRKIGD